MAVISSNHNTCIVDPHLVMRFQALVAGLLCVFDRFASTLFQKLPKFHHSVCFPLSGFDELNLFIASVIRRD